MPETTPYFDIVRFKTTPMDQLIPHLAVQCGDKHVTPLCQALLSVLTGKGSALFIPRYAFNTMTPDQIKRHFEVHKNWSRSLKSIPLTPKVSHLDRQRVEYFDDGSIVKRSTREWIQSLTLGNGQSAYCDAVNGGSIRQATLVCPQTYFEQAQDEWRQYKSRLNPPSHRENRYFDSLSNLPELNNIRTEIEFNVSLLNRLSTADIWKKAPPSVHEPGPKQGRQERRPKLQTKRSQSSSTHARSVDQSEQRSGASYSESATTTGDSLPDDLAAQSTASTAASTNAPQPDQSTRIQELERMIKNAQKRSDVEGKASAMQLSGLQSRFNDLDGKISALQTNQEKLSNEISTMKDQTTQQYNEIRGNIVTSMEVTNDISQSMVDIRQQFSQMSTFMMELAKRMELVIDRRDGVPPEVNVTRPNHNHPHHGSETSSVIGDPSQAANSDVSKTISFLSSTGKRSLAAVQVPAQTDASTSNTLRRSPIKKKQRARESHNIQDDESTDEEDNANDHQRVNLDEKFQSVSDTETKDHEDAATTDNTAPASQDTTMSESVGVEETQLQPPINKTQAPLNQQYNEANGSAGAGSK